MPKAGFRDRKKSKKIVISYVTNSCYVYSNKLKPKPIYPAQQPTRQWCNAVCLLIDRPLL